MTIRSRLVFGLLTIAVALLVPFLFALSTLDSLHSSTLRLQQNEITGSLIIGRIRETIEELRKTEIILAFGTEPSYADSMRITYGRLQRLTDSLRERTPEGVNRIDSAVADLGRYIAEHERVALGRTPAAEAVADSIFQRHLRPAIDAIGEALPLLERQLDVRTEAYFLDAAATSERAKRAGMVGLAVAALLAGAVAFWLTRSISMPVRDLERAMSTVADGDFSYALSTEQRGPAEFSRLSRSYRTMVRQLAELDKLKAEFVSIASHELKTPINVIIGYLQLLEEGVYGDLNPKQREICRVLETQSQGLGRLVHQLLDVSRFEAGGGRLETRAIELPRFVADLHDSFAVLAIQRKIDFRIVQGEGLPQEVVWDEDRISEVIGNLLSNAFKFTEGGGTVELSVYNVEGAVRIAVRDTGAGIPQDQLPHIFAKFYQVASQSSASLQGTGLGLAIAKEIVNAHQGEISVESIVGRGTTFTITLPYRVATGAQMLRRNLTPAAEIRAER